MIRMRVPILIAAIVLVLNAGLALAEKAAPDLTLQGHSSMILDVAFSPDGKRLASVGDDGMLKVWDLVAKKELATFKDTKTNQNRARFTPDSKVVATLGSSSEISVLDVETGKPHKSIPLAALIGGATGIDLSPDGKKVAVAGRSTIRLYDLATANPAGEFESHKGYGIAAVAYSNSGKMLAAVSSDNTATVVDAANGKVLHSYPLRLNGACVAFSRDDKTLFVGTTDRAVSSFDVESGATKLLMEPMQPILSLAVSNDGKMLVIGGVGHAPAIVKLPEGTASEQTVDSEEWVKCAAVSPDGTWLAGGSHGGSVFLWKIAK